MVFIVLHNLGKSLLRKLLESISIKQWARRLTNCITILFGRWLVHIWLMRRRRYLVWPLLTENLLWRLWGYNGVKTWELAWLVRWTIIIVLRVQFYVFCLDRFNAQEPQLFYVADFGTRSLTFSWTFNCFENSIWVFNLVILVLFVWVCFFWTVMTLSLPSPTVVDFVFIDT